MTALGHILRRTICFQYIRQCRGFCGLVGDAMDRGRIAICLIFCVCYWGVLGPFLTRFPTLNPYAKMTVILMGMVGILGSAIIIGLSVAALLTYYSMLPTTGESFSSFLSGVKRVKALPQDKVRDWVISGKSDELLWDNVTSDMYLINNKRGSNLFHYPDLLQFLLVVTPDPLMRLTTLMSRNMSLNCACNQAAPRQLHPTTSNNQPCELWAKSHSLVNDFGLAIVSNHIHSTVQMRTLKELSR